MNDFVQPEECMDHLLESHGQNFSRFDWLKCKAYVDDIVVKSNSCHQHKVDLIEVLQALQRNNMKLNPNKCVFRVEDEKFLGFMLTHREIEANPDKCQAITDMRSPKNVKERQKLIGKLTALSRFIPKLA